MALTASFEGTFSTRDINVTRYPLSSSETIYKNSLMGLSTSGYLITPSTGATSRQVVFVIDPAIPSTGYAATAAGVVANADANTFLCVDAGYLTYTFSTTLSQASVGADAYVVDNGTLAATTTGICIAGTITKYISTTVAEIALKRN